METDKTRAYTMFTDKTRAFMGLTVCVGSIVLIISIYAGISDLLNLRKSKIRFDKGEIVSVVTIRDSEGKAVDKYIADSRVRINNDVLWFTVSGEDVRVKTKNYSIEVRKTEEVKK